MKFEKKQVEVDNGIYGKVTHSGYVCGRYVIYKVGRVWALDFKLYDDVETLNPRVGPYFQYLSAIKQFATNLNTIVPDAKSASDLINNKECYAYWASHHVSVQDKVWRSKKAQPIE